MATSHDPDQADFGRTAEKLGRAAERIGRAAEGLAERVACDARQFAERIAAHATAFARDVAGDWPRVHPDDDRARPGGSDLRRAFDIVRAVAAEVIDGVDGLLSDLVPRDDREPWTRAVLNRSATCEGCAAALEAGHDAWRCCKAGGAAFRCLTCGAPGGA